MGSIASKEGSLSGTEISQGNWGTISKESQKSLREIRLQFQRRRVSQKSPREIGPIFQRRRISQKFTRAIGPLSQRRSLSGQLGHYLKEVSQGN